MRVHLPWCEKRDDGSERAQDSPETSASVTMSELCASVNSTIGGMGIPDIVAALDVEIDKLQKARNLLAGSFSVPTARSAARRVKVNRRRPKPAPSPVAQPSRDKSPSSELMAGERSVTVQRVPPRKRRQDGPRLPGRERGSENAGGADRRGPGYAGGGLCRASARGTAFRRARPIHPTTAVPGNCGSRAHPWLSPPGARTARGKGSRRNLSSGSSPIRRDPVASLSISPAACGTYAAFLREGEIFRWFYL